MKKVVNLDMLFPVGNVPDFGSIEANPKYPGEYTLLAIDIPKLNSLLTRAACSEYLDETSPFSITSGSNAVVVDVPAVWRYHAGTDRWYEVVAND